MKIKSNTKNLIPRKLISGFILKYREPTDGIRRLGVYKGHSYGVDKAGNYRFLNTSQNVWLLVAKNKLNLKQQQPEVYKYFSNVIDGTESFRGKPLKQNKGPVKGKWFIAQNDWNYNGKQIKKGDTYLISTKDNSVTIKPKNKPTDTLSIQNPGTQGKPAGTQGSDTKGGIRGNSIRGNARSTAKPAATTTTTIPVATSTTTPASTSTENAGNYTIQRGDTLGTLAKRFGMSVDELARLNNISNPNRIYAGRTLITKAPTAETSDIKVETPNVPDYGYGVTDSNLKLGTDLQYYPSYNLDELLRSAFSKFGLNFDDYKQLTADKLPTDVAPVSQEVKTFNPGNTILTPSYRALRNARLEDEALKRSKLLPFAKQGTKLIRRK